jgi:ribulose-phosphate 3-epimerase
VAGSAVFRGKSVAEYAANIQAIRSAAETGRVPKQQDDALQPTRLGEGARTR